MKKLIVSVFIIIFSSVVNADAIPDDFKDFFSPKIKSIQINDIEGKSHSFDMLVTFDTFKMAHAVDKSELTRIFTDSGIKEKSSNQMVSQLYAENTNSLRCSGDLALCGVGTEYFSFYYDDHTSQLFVYVNKKLVVEKKGQDKIKYANTYNPNVGLINTFNFFTANTLTNSASYALKDDFKVALPLGGVAFDGYLSSDSDSSELSKLYYNIGYDNLNLNAGYSDTRLVDNTTSLLDFGMNYKAYSVSLSSSNNLANKSEVNNKVINFLSPVNGLLSVKKDDKILIQRNVAQGQGYISYSELPRGTYTIAIEISSSNQVVYQDFVRVYNTTDMQLVTGEGDFNFEVGSIQANKDIEADSEDRDFVNGALSYQLFNGFYFASSLMYSEGEDLLSAGLSAYLPYDIRYKAVMSKGSNQDESYVYHSLDINGIALSYEQLHLTDDYNLINQLYGDNDFSQIMLTGSTTLAFDIFSYASISKYKMIDRSANLDSDTLNVSLGLSRSFIRRSYLDLGISYNHSYSEQSSFDDPIELTLTWTIPLGDHFTGRSQFSGNTKTGLDQYSNYIDSNDYFNESQEMRLTSSLGNTYLINDATGNESVNDLSLSATYDNDKYNVDSYSYISDSGRKGVNLSVSSTQVVSKSGVVLTTDKADAYAVVNTTNNFEFGEHKTRDKGVVLLKDNGKLIGKEIINEEAESIPLYKYKPMTAGIDVSSVDLYNSGESTVSGFTHPGSVLNISTDITRVISFIAQFNNVLDVPINSLECEGSACLGMSELATGIQKVSVKQGMEFTLKSSSETCLIAPIHKDVSLNLGTSYCVPDVKPGQQVAIFDGKEIQDMLFIGMFERGDFINDFIDELTKEEFDVVSRNIGNKVIVYVKNKTDLPLNHDVMKRINDIVPYSLNMNKSHLKISY